MEQEGLGADEEIRNEPNERETERLLAFAPERPAAYEKFRVGRRRQQPKRWIIPAQIALKVSFWSLGMWGHRAWKYFVPLLVSAFVCSLIAFVVCSSGPSDRDSICCNKSPGTEKWSTCCYQQKYAIVVNGTFITASFLSYLVFVACYLVGKRTTSALVCPPQFLIKETDKPVIFVLFLAFLMNVLLLLANSAVWITVFNAPENHDYSSTSALMARVAVFFLLPSWVSLNVCQVFASICIVLGRLTDTIG